MAKAKRNCTLSIRINEQLKEQLETIAEQQENSMSSIVAIALKEYFEKLNEK